MPDTQTMHRVSTRNKRCTMHRAIVRLGGAEEVTTVIESEHDTVTLKTSTGTLALLKISHETFGSSFAHLDHDALHALKAQIDSFLKAD